MLFEVINVQQVRGQPLQRWFCSYDQDLLVWFDEGGALVAFELRYGDDRAIRWNVDRGFVHCDARRVAPVLEQFTKLAFEMPPEIAEFVAARLREHPQYQPE